MELFSVAIRRAPGPGTFEIRIYYLFYDLNSLELLSNGQSAYDQHHLFLWAENTPLHRYTVYIVVNLLFVKTTA